MSTTQRAGVGDSFDLLWPLLEFLPVAALVADDAGHIVAANQSAEVAFGYQAGDLLGEAIDDVILRRRRREQQWRRKGPRPGEVELRGRRADGRAFPIDANVVRLEGREGLFVLTIVQEDRGDGSTVDDGSQSAGSGAFLQLNDTIIQRLFIAGLAIEELMAAPDRWVGEVGDALRGVVEMLDGTIREIRRVTFEQA